MRRLIAIMLLTFMLAVCVPSGPSLAEEDNNDTFTIVWLSDTQDMSYHGYNHAMQKMGVWIASQKQALNIRYVVQTGDAVENGANPRYWAEFDLMLNEFKDEIPYIGAAGNHEVKKGYQDYLNRPEIVSIPKENVYKDGEASFQTFEVDECKFIIIGVGSGIEEESTGWVNSVLQSHKDYVAILLYHDYLQTAGRFSKNGKSMFKQVVVTNPNVRLVLCGHVCEGEYSVSSRVDSFDDNSDGTMDRNVYQMMYNYQSCGYGNNGQLRILSFDTKDRSITVTTYSPITKKYYRDWMNGDEYTFTLKDAF